jgi:hypothetical protein
MMSWVNDTLATLLRLFDVSFGIGIVRWGLCLCEGLANARKGLSMQSGDGDTDDTSTL